MLADGSGLSSDNRLTCDAARRRARPRRRRPVRSAPGCRSPARRARWPTSSPTRRWPGGCGPRRARSTRTAEGAVGLRRRSTGGATIEFSLRAERPDADDRRRPPIWDALGDVLATYPAARRPSTLGPATRSADLAAERHAPSAVRLAGDGGAADVPARHRAAAGRACCRCTCSSRATASSSSTACDDGEPEFGVALIERGQRGRRRRPAHATSARSPGWSRSSELDGRPLRARRRRHAADPGRRLAARRPVPARRRRRLAGRGRRRRRRSRRAGRRGRTARLRRVLALAVELGEPADRPRRRDRDDPLLASYHLAALGADRPGRPLPAARCARPAEPARPARPSCSTTSRRCCGSASAERRTRSAPTPIDGGRERAAPVVLRTAPCRTPRRRTTAERQRARSATSSTSSRRTPSRRRSAR